MARAQGARSQLAAAFETTYGTAPASGYTRLPFASFDLSGAQALQSSELLGYGRDPLAPVLDALDVDGQVVVPIDAIGFGFWLKAAFGQPTTTGTGTFTHEFRTGNWTLPSLALELAMPDVPNFAMYPGAKVSMLSWTMARKGLLTASVDLVSQGETFAATTAVGTPTDITLARFNHFHGSVKRDTALLGDVVSASVKYDNGLDRVETIRADGKIEGLDAGMAAMTGELTTRFSSMALLDQATAGTACRLDFGYTISASQSLTVTIHEVYLPRPKRSVDGPQGIQATFDWQAARAASPGRMATITLVNNRATY